MGWAGWAAGCTHLHVPCSGGSCALHRQLLSHDAHTRCTWGGLLQACILRTARDVARGLDHLHSALALVHRDL